MVTTTLRFSDGRVVRLVETDHHVDVRQSGFTIRRYLALITFPILINSVNPAYYKHIIKRNTPLYSGTSLIQTGDFNVGTYIDKNLETRVIDLSDTKQTIENTKDIEHIMKSLERIEKNIALLPTKSDIEGVKTDVKYQIEHKVNKVLLYLLGVAGLVALDVILPIILNALK